MSPYRATGGEQTIGDAQTAENGVLPETPPSPQQNDIAVRAGGTQAPLAEVSARRHTGARLRRMTQVALLAAALSVIGPFSLPIPLSPAPLSLFTLFLYVIASVCGVGRSVGAVALYLLIGLCGLPVFASFRGGAGAFLSPSGGFLIGYLLCALCISLLSSRPTRKKKSENVNKYRHIIAFLRLLVGSLPLYVCGAMWYIVLTEASPIAAILVCVLPYLPLDILKMALSCALIPPFARAFQATE